MATDRTLSQGLRPGGVPAGASEDGGNQSGTEERRPEPVGSTPPKPADRPVLGLGRQIKAPTLASVRLVTETTHKDARSPPSEQMEPIH